MTIADIGEFPLIERIDAVLRKSAPQGLDEVVLGVGDDAAVLRFASGWDRIVTCDVQVAGRHFRPDWMDARMIGRRAMSVNLSDLAAMGAEPRQALISLGLPADMPVAEVLDLYHGFTDALAGTGAVIVGGNLSSSGPEWFCDITLIGRTPEGRALLRSGSRPGDAVVVTGSPGRSAAGLALLQRLFEELTQNRPGKMQARSRGASRPVSYPDILATRREVMQEIERFLRREPWARVLVDAYRSPVPRLEAGRWLRERAFERSSGAGDPNRRRSRSGPKKPGSLRPISALIDLSDGILGDLSRICERSGVRAVVDARRLPADAELERASAHLSRSRPEWTLVPGDDYELLFTVRPEEQEIVTAGLEAATGLATSVVGRTAEQDSPARSAEKHPRRRGDAAEEGSPVSVQGIARCSASAHGWDHFRGRPDR